MIARQDRHIVVFQEADTFESLSAIGQRVQRQFHRTGIQLIERVQQADRPNLEHDRRRQRGHAVHKARDDRPRGIVVGSIVNVREASDGSNSSESRVTRMSCSA